MTNAQNIDLRSFAVISLLVLWTSLTFSIALTEITFVCALVCWIGWHIQLRTRSSCTAPLTIDWALWTPLGLFFILVLFSFFISEYPKQSFQGLYKIAKPILAFVMAGELFRDAHFRKRFGDIFLATFLMVMMDCSIQYTFGKDLLRGFSAFDSGSGLRLVGSFGNYAKMATYLVLVIPVFVMRFWSDLRQPGHRKKSFLYLGLAVSGFILLYLTRCRGPMVALGLSLGLLFIYKRWFKALGIAVILCLALLAMVPRNVLIHLDADNKEQSIVERFELWKRALNVIEAEPWTGTGINTYNVAHAKYDKEQNWRVRGYYAHNGYLQLAAEIGIPGIFFLLLFFFMFFRKALRSLGAVRGSPEEYTRLGLITGLLAFLLYAACDNNLQSPPSLMFFWFTAGILRAMQQGGPEVKTA